jgi:hypothetical protein
MDSLPSFVTPSASSGPNPDSTSLPDFVSATPGFVASDGLPSFVNPSARPEGGFVNGFESVAKTVGNVVADVFSSPIGPNEKDLAPFTQGGVPGPIGDLVHSFNRAFIGGTQTALDLTSRVGTAALMGGAAAVGETARQLGMSDSDAGKLTRDLVGLGISAGIVMGSSPATPKFADFARGVDAPEGAATTVDAATRSAPDVGAEASAAPSATPAGGLTEPAAPGVAEPPEGIRAVPEDSNLSYFPSPSPIAEGPAPLPAGTPPQIVIGGRTVSPTQFGELSRAEKLPDAPWLVFDPKNQTGYEGVFQTEQQAKDFVEEADKQGKFFDYGTPRQIEEMNPSGEETPEYIWQSLKTQIDKAMKANDNGAANAAIDQVRALGDDLAKSGALDDAVSSLPPEMQAAAKEDLKKAFADGVDSVAEDAAPPPPSDIKTPLTEERIAQPLQKSVVDAASALLEAGNVTRDPGRLLSDQIMELLQTNRLSTPEIGSILQEHGLSGTDFAELWRVNIRKAAQDLQSLSTVEQRLKALQGEPGAESALAGTLDQITPDTRAMGWFRQVDNIRRGLMVSQLSTAARNFMSQVGRVGLDTLEQGLSGALRRVFGQATPLESPTDAFAGVMNMFRPLQTKAEVDGILNAFPKEQDALFGNVMSDIVAKGSAGDVLGKAQTAVRVLNTANQLQEFVVRRAAFAASLDRRLARQGLDLGDIIDKNAIGSIPRDAIKGAVNDALELTFAKNFSPMADGAEGLAGNFIRLVNGIPGASFILPFPRFLMNAVKFQYEFSPAGFLKLTSAAERAKIASGDMSAISRATLGSAMLLGAYQLRNSGYAGEKFYELKLPDGRTIDTRPYNPFTAYLFVADLAKRLKDGTLDRLQTTDIVNGVLSSSLRAGVGLYAVDSVLNGLSGLGNLEKALRAVEDSAGNVVSTALVPLQQISEIFSAFDNKASVLRSSREGPYLGIGQGAGPAPAVGINAGPAMRMIPGLQNNLPPVQLPTRSAPPTQEAPMLKLLTGISLNNPKNSGEVELDRLGFTTKDIAPSTGDPKADRLVNSKMGPIFEHVIVPLVEAPGYQRLSDTAKPLVMAEALHAIHGIAEKQAAAENPAYFGRLKLEAIPTRERRLIESITGRPMGDLIPVRP